MDTENLQFRARLKSGNLFAVTLGLSLAALLHACAFCLASGRPQTLQIGNQEHTRLERFALNEGMRLHQHSPDAITMDGDGMSIIYFPGQRKIVFDGVQLYMNGDVQSALGGWFLPTIDQTDIVAPLLHPDRHLAGYRCEVVVLDPGHGGNDPGAVSPGGLYEKDLALDISKRVRDILEEAGLEVHLTRDDDRYMQLGFRPRIAARKNADIFVSIHLNAAENGKARGVETYRLTATGFPSMEGANETKFAASDQVGNGYNGANTLLGFHIQKTLQSSTGSPERGLRHARFAVLRDANSPAVLVECGFLSNPAEEGLLATEEYRNKVAKGIADGILSYREAADRANADELADARAASAATVKGPEK